MTLAAQPARLVLRADDQIGNKGSVFALCTVMSQPSQAGPRLAVIVDNACATEVADQSFGENQCRTSVNFSLLYQMQLDRVLVTSLLVELYAAPARSLTSSQ